MGSRRRWSAFLCLLLSLDGVGCAASEPSFAPELQIPAYPAEDARPNEPGFVSAVRLASTELRLIGFTLMAFQVGETLTLGAMTNRPFEGQAKWRIGDHTLAVDFARAAGTDPVPVRLTGPRPGSGAEPLSGQPAGVGGYRWINIELPAATWLDREPQPLSLTFEFPDGAKISLPAAGHYDARRIYR